MKKPALRFDKSVEVTYKDLLDKISDFSHEDIEQLVKDVTKDYSEMEENLAAYFRQRFLENERRKQK